MIKTDVLTCRQDLVRENVDKNHILNINNIYTNNIVMNFTTLV